MAEPDVTTLPTPIPTALNVSALAKRYGVARSTIQRRIKRGWSTPSLRKPRKPAGAALATAPAASSAAPTAAPNAAPDAAPSATPHAAPSAAPNAAPAPQQSRAIAVAALLAALALAACSAAFSINGLTSIFVTGAKVAAIRAIGLWRRSGWEAAGRRHLEH
jgi:hypothetical protein